MPDLKPIVLIRRYKNAQGRLVKFPQCKIVDVDNEMVCYRDIFPNRSQLFRDNSWNIDHKALDFLKENGVEKIYYFEIKSNAVYKITVKKIENALERGDARKEQLNHHTQVFIPKYLWSPCPEEEKEVINAGKRWVYDVHVLGESGNSSTEIKRVSDVHIVEDWSIPADTKYKLRAIFKAKYAGAAGQA